MLRQRRNTADLLEPLLSTGASSEGQGAESASRLWTAAASFCTLAVAAGTALYAYVFWCSASSPPLSDDEEEALERLRERALLPFDAGEDVALLHTLWALTVPEQPLPAPRGPHWSALGWQGHDPATDLRAAGRLAAECLLHFARSRPDAWGCLVRKEHGVRSQWEYPCAAGGVNLLASLVDALGVARLLPQNRGKALTPNRAFAAVLARHPDAFEELFCSTFVRLDKEWLEAKASYMDFPHICSRTIAATLAALDGDSDSDLASICRHVEAQ